MQEQRLVDQSDPRVKVALPKLSDEQLKSLRRFGRELTIPLGASVFEGGDTSGLMHFVLEGEIEVFNARNGEYVAAHKKGGFTGDTDLLSGRPRLASGRAGANLRVLEVSAEGLRAIVGELPQIGDIILRAFLMRKSVVQEFSAYGPLVIGLTDDAHTLHIREFLARNRLPFAWEPFTESGQQSLLLDKLGLQKSDLPAVVLLAGEVLKSPTLHQLGAALGLHQRLEPKIYDLLVIGAGPSGLTAAVYGASEGLSTLVLDSEGPGGQAGSTSRIENYMGFPNGISGRDLADRGVAQAERFGAHLLVPARAVSLTCHDNGIHQIETDAGLVLAARSLLLATGASYRKLDLHNLAQFEGRGVYYSATNLELSFAAGHPVAVVGGGNSAGQAAVFLAEHCSHVFLVVRGKRLDMMSEYLVQRVSRSPKITLLLESEIAELSGDTHLETVTIRDRKTNVTRVEPASCVFAMIGAVPHTSWLPSTIERDERGFVITGRAIADSPSWTLSRSPFYLETTAPGVFAAGDARSGSIKRVASAVGEGSMAVALIHQYLALAAEPAPQAV